MISKVMSALVLLMPCMVGAWDMGLAAFADSFDFFEGSYDFTGSYDYGYSTIQSVFYSEQLNEGETVELLSHGPFTVTAACTAVDGDPVIQARLLLSVEAGLQDEWVYGSPDWITIGNKECVGTTPAGTTTSDCVGWSYASGITGFGGALTSLSGYYVSFGGTRAIGFSKDYLSDPENAFYHDGYTADDVAAFPYDCAMSGEITYNG